MPSVYYKIGEPNNTWLDEQAKAAGISKAQAIDTIISVARIEGWTLRGVEGPQVQRPGHPSPVAGPGTSSQEGYQ